MTIIEKEQPDESLAMWQSLEHASMPPWLWHTGSELEKKLTLFPEGNVIDQYGGFIGVKTHWNGFEGGLYPHYDKHNPNGNTLVITDLFLGVDKQKQPDAISHLLTVAKDICKKQQLQFLLACLPVGEYWYKAGTSEQAFNTYIHSKTLYADRFPGVADPRLHLYTMLNGLQLIDSDFFAISKSVPYQTFLSYQVTFKPESWSFIDQETAHCAGTNGIWELDNFPFDDIVTYYQPGVWMAKSYV